METTMNIENASWTLDALFIKKDLIAKPKFQRDKKWTLTPEKKNIPNYKDYINFLISNKNSVFPISLGTEIKDGIIMYIVIDGNNRLNSIITFLENPYLIFSEYYDNLFETINSSEIDKNIKDKIISSIKALSYKQISNFRRLGDILPSIVISSELFRNIEDELINIQKKFIYKDNTCYDNIIKLNINIFTNGTYENYLKIFEDINKHSNILSENELLSAILFTTNIKIRDDELKYKLLTKIKEFYDNKGKGEVLTQFKFDIKEYDIKCINAFDFMIGFQNYCNMLYPVINKFETSGLSLFFKIFKFLYDSVSADKYTDENINNFINKITFACNIVNKAFLKIFPDNINQNLFNSTCVKYNEKELIKKNNMAILLISNISNKDKYNEIDLINKNRACIIYHLLCNKNYLKKLDTIQIADFIKYDSIRYFAGGGFVDIVCKDILYKDTNKIFKLSKDSFKNLLKECIKSVIDEQSFEEKPSKRRKLTLLDKILFSNYWNRNIPNKHLKEKYSLEHITPFSSNWNGKIDIDRIGNIFPTFEHINSKRGNKDLEIYKTEKDSLFENIKQILPYEKYHDINKILNKKTTIISIEKYNEYCYKNEDIYINQLLDDIFN
jgi:hypothetical protein